jgi:dTDP-4-amino-4,6-dideoxygalactose transaminase
MRETVDVRLGVGSCRISARARELVLQVLDSHRLSSGPMMARLERGLADLHGCRYGLMCNSGTSALQIALAALKERDGWNDGDEVLVPAVTFVATANVVFYNGLRPVFVDVEPDYFCMDPSQIERHITPRTRAIMPVHIGGLPADMPAIAAVAESGGLRIVEDSAEAMFVSVGGRPVGSWSDISCFSSYVAHVISTGVGGYCLTNDADLLERLKSLMNHGRDPIYTRIDDDLDVTDGQLTRIATSRFSFVRFGHSFRCTELEAAIGLAELEERDAAQAERTRVADALRAGLADLEWALQLPAVRPGAGHGFMFFPIVVRDPALDRDRLIVALERRGIETRYLLPLINQPVYRPIFGDLDPEYPVAARLNRQAFYVGCHRYMTDADVECVVAAFHEIVGAGR